MYEMTAKIQDKGKTQIHAITCYSESEVIERREHFRSLASRGSVLTIKVKPAKR